MATATPIVEKRERPGFRWFVLAVILAVQLHLVSILFAPAALAQTILRELHVTITQFGFIMAVINVTVMVSVPLGSILVDRLGLKWALLCGIGSIGGGAVLVVLASSLGPLLALRALQGIGIAISYPVLGALIMAWFADREQPYINTLYAAGAFLGTGGTFIITAELLRWLQGSWRAVLSCYGVTALAVGLLWGVVGRERASSVDRTTDTDKAEQSQNSLAVALRMRIAWKLSVGIFASAWVYNMYFSFVPLFLQTERAVGLSAANRLASLLPFSGVAGVVFFGLLSSRFSLRKHLLWSSCSLVVVGSVALFYGRDVVMIFGLVLTGFALSGFLPVSVTYMMALPRMTPSLVAAFLVMINVATYLAGFVAPFAVGYLSQGSLGLRNALALLSWVELLGIGMFALLPASTQASHNTRC